MAIILVALFIICVAIFTVLTKKADGFLGDFIMAVFIGPIITAVVMLVGYIVLYGFSLGLLWMLFPLILPIGFFVKKGLEQRHYGKIYDYHHPKIEEEVKKVFDEKGVLALLKDCLVLTTYLDKEDTFKNFMSKDSKKIRVNVTLRPSIKIANEINPIKKEIQKRCNDLLSAVYGDVFVYLEMPSGYESK